MTVVLTAMNRFLNEDNGLQMAFLDGNQPERLCAPMKDYIEVIYNFFFLSSAHILSFHKIFTRKWYFFNYDDIETSMLLTSSLFST